MQTSRLLARAVMWMRQVKTFPSLQHTSRLYCLSQQAQKCFSIGGTRPTDETWRLNYTRDIEQNLNSVTYKPSELLGNAAH
jgi:hypothetical protein